MAKEKKLIAFVVYPECTLLELVGPYTILMGALMLSGYRLVVVGERTEPLESDTPLSLIPQKTFAEVPQPHGIIVIGSSTSPGQALENRVLVDYVRRAGETAELVGAISTGSLILAAAGLLKNRQATTHWAYASKLAEMGARYVRQPWIEDGKFLTAAGVSGGIDMGLYLGAKLAKKSTVRQSQLFSEYDPQPPFGRIDWSQVNGHTPESPKAPVAALEKGKTIALVIYQGLTVFDLVGPLQVYTALARIDPHFRVMVVAERIEPIKTDLGIQMIPNRTFDQIPQPNVVIVPGGSEPTLRAMSNPAIRRYVRTAAETAEIVGSVCTGALILAGVGLLDGRQATTHWAYDKILEQFGASYQRQRWVEDGKFLMSAGVSAGIDTALFLVSRLTDEETARQVQLDIQYDPQPPFGGIDYDHLGALPRFVRGVMSLRASFIAAKPKRLTRQGV